MTKYRLTLLLAITHLAAIAVFWAGAAIAQDFFPLYFGAGWLLDGQLPYGKEATEALARVWLVPEPFRNSGLAYPLPAIMLLLPLALLPFLLASIVWTVVGWLLAVAGSARITGSTPLLPLLYWPLLWSAILGQATLLWIGLAALLVVAMQQKRPWLAGVCIALLPLKPQAGLLFALAGCWWAWREQRRALLVAGATAGLLGIGSLLLAPAWLSSWLSQLTLYDALVDPQLQLAWLFPLLIACWRLPWFARLAIVQVFAFPMVSHNYGADPYVLLPLLLAWVGIGGRVALLGVACSWLWLPLLFANLGLLAGPLALFVPLLLAGSWRFFQSTRRSLPAPPPLRTPSPEAGASAADSS